MNQIHLAIASVVGLLLCEGLAEPGPYAYYSGRPGSRPGHPFYLRSPVAECRQVDDPCVEHADCCPPLSCVRSHNLRTELKHCKDKTGRRGTLYGGLLDPPTSNECKQVDDPCVDHADCCAPLSCVRSHNLRTGLKHCKDKTRRRSAGHAGPLGVPSPTECRQVDDPCVDHADCCAPLSCVRSHNLRSELKHCKDKTIR